MFWSSTHSCTLNLWFKFKEAATTKTYTHTAIVWVYLLDLRDFKIENVELKLNLLGGSVLLNGGKIQQDGCIVWFSIWIRTTNVKEKLFILPKLAWVGLS